jgi:hypothetical protein
MNIDIDKMRKEAVEQEKARDIVGEFVFWNGRIISLKAELKEANILVRNSNRTVYFAEEYLNSVKKAITVTKKKQSQALKKYNVYLAEKGKTL